MDPSLVVHHAPERIALDHGEVADHGDENILDALIVQRARQMMVIDHVVVLVRPEHDRDHVLAESSARFLADLCSRQRLRFSFTSRIPTVIWVGRSDRIGIGLKDRFARIGHDLKPSV